MSKRYPGNFITGNPVTLSQTSNNGIWDVKDVSAAVDAGTWQEADGIHEIGKSLRCRASNSSYLTRTPDINGNGKTFTLSAWVKRSAIGVYQIYFSAGATTVTNGYVHIGFNSDDKLYLSYYSTGSHVYSTDKLFRDPSAWYHMVFVLNTSTGAQGHAVYVNGESVPLVRNVSYSELPANFTSAAGRSAEHRLFVGSSGGGTRSGFLDGYMTEINFVDGQALDPSYFGYFDPITNIWQPKPYSGSYGTGGFYLPFNSRGDFSSLLADRRSDNTKPSSNGLIVTQLNSSTLSSTQTLYGATSLRMAGSTSTTIGTTSSPDMKSGSQDFTVECWVRLDATTGNQEILASAATSGSDATSSWNFAVNSSSKWILFCYFSGSYGAIASTATITANAWTHLVAQRIGNTLYFHVNGTLQGSISVSGSMVATTGQAVSTSLSNISGWVGATGYLDSFRYTHGVGRYGSSNFTSPTSAFPVGEYDAYWGATTLVQYYGSNGDASNKALCYSSNYWQSSGFSLTPGVTYDSMVDSPTNVFTSATDVGGVVTGNYCTWNPIDKGGNVTVSNANLDLSNGASYSGIRGTMALPTTGKWYFEWKENSARGSNVIGEFFIAGVNTTLTGNAYSTGVAAGSAIAGVYWGSSGIQIAADSVGSNWMTTYIGSGDIVQLAIDMDSGKFWVGINNTWYRYTGNAPAASTRYTDGNPSAGTNQSGTLTTNQTWIPYINLYSCNGSGNFGQQTFAYTPPTGFKSLNTTNLQSQGTTTVGKAAIQPQKWFDVSLWSGNGVDTGKVSGLNFKPDLVWTKQRDIAQQHAIMDSVRGVGAVIDSSTTAAEYTALTYGQLQSFDNDGFTFTKGSDASYSFFNKAGGSYAGWNWKQSPTSGVNIVPYTGNGSNMTISHNLGAAPKVIIIKERTSVSNWVIQHHSLGWGSGFLGWNAAVSTTTAFSNNTAPTSSNFTVSTYSYGDGNNNRNYIAYVFAEVPGFSKFGSYIGNGGTDGTFVHLGFRPRFLLIKPTNASIWELHDTSRLKNGNGIFLRAHSQAAEAVDNSYPMPDIVSNGFKCRSIGGAQNDSGVTYVYMAFAESPFALNNRAR